MPLALDEATRALATSAAELCRRRAPLEATREELSELSAGAPGPAWKEIVDQGFHALHLTEASGGSGGTLMDLAVVAEQFGRHLLPGPWLPTVLASGVLRHADGPLARELEQEFASGSTGAVVLRGLTAVEDGPILRISGLSDLTVGLPGAEVVLARVELAGSATWCRLRPGIGAVEAVMPVDVTGSVGTVELDWAKVPRSEIVAMDDEGALLVIATLVCAQSAGVASWALDAAVEHLRTRHQFGRPLGAFQALQHRAALMMVRSQAAVAAAWDAARAEAQDEVEWPLASAQALVTGPEPAVDVVFDLVTMLGALGITWEHDAHLYLRRAISLTGIAGPRLTWARRLGEAGEHHERASRLDDLDALPALRADVGTVLDAFLGMAAEDDRHHDPWGRWTGGQRQRLLADHGLIAPQLPSPHGRGAGPEAQAVIADEFARRGLAQPTLIVGDWALATLVAHGTEEQKHRLIWPSVRGEIVWCQLFSEPEAGSDLASLRTRAVRVEGGWQLTGQKIWNSRACEAQWGICLARTGPGSTRHEGLSYFLVDMSSAGVDARPIRQSNGQTELAEVFLDDVFVPDSLVVGSPGDGWRLAVTTLSNERLQMGSRLKYGSSALVRRLLDERSHDVARDDVLAAVGECMAREICLASMNLRSVLGLMAGQEMSAEISVNKVLNSIAQRDGSRALLGLLGPKALDDSSAFVADYLGMPAMLFGGGTVEVQLNLIATRVLGLPRA